MDGGLDGGLQRRHLRLGGGQQRLRLSDIKLVAQSRFQATSSQFQALSLQFDILFQDDDPFLSAPQFHVISSDFGKQYDQHVTPVPLGDRNVRIRRLDFPS